MLVKGAPDIEYCFNHGNEIPRNVTPSYGDGGVGSSKTLVVRSLTDHFPGAGHGLKYGVGKYHFNLIPRLVCCISLLYIHSPRFVLAVQS